MHPRAVVPERHPASTVAPVQTTAIIPLKALADAKQRLAGALDGDDRMAFVAWMAGRVIAAAKGCEGISDVLLVAGDEDAAAVGRQAGVDTMIERTPGLAAALAAADAATSHADATLVLAADLPEVSPHDLDVVLRAARHEPIVVIAPTRDGGTGALLRRPGGVIATAYGPGSAAAHAALARAAGVAVVMVDRAALANDVDTPGELPAALALAAEHDVGCAPRT